MAKLYTGIDIGASRLKMAVCNDQDVAQVAIEDLPANLVQDGRITSYSTMAEVMRDAVRKNHISAKNCALTLNSRDVFTRRITIPAMTVNELRLNLPYEFRDYIADDKDKYRFDYAVLRTKRDARGIPEEMELLACAALNETLNAYAGMFRRAGLKLVRVAPDIVAYSNLITAHERRCASEGAAVVDARESVGSSSMSGAPTADAQELYPRPRDYCFVNIGNDGTRAYLFPQGCYEITRQIDFDTTQLTSVVANAFSVDPVVANTYVLSDFEGAQHLQPCLDLYERLGVEVARIVSFFNFNYPESQLSELYFCGSGTNIIPLMDTLRNHVSIPLVNVAQLLPPSSAPTESLRDCAASVGIALQ